MNEEFSFDFSKILNWIVANLVNVLFCLTNISCFGLTIYLTNLSTNKYLILSFQIDIYSDEVE